MHEQHFRFNVSNKNFNSELRGEITLVLSEKLKTNQEFNY